jgi:hypothetical protein
MFSLITDFYYRFFVVFVVGDIFWNLAPFLTLAVFLHFGAFSGFGALSQLWRCFALAPPQF